MKYFVGIDLGTTNSAISIFDGENVRVCKSKSGQADVTPSAIYVDKRGRRFHGRKAYEESFRQPERCAKLFKRFMGTNTKFTIGNEELTPEECSAEILRELFKNLRGEIRSKIQGKIQAADQKMRVSFANFVVDKLAAGNFGVVIEDFFGSYKLEMTAFFYETTEKIFDLLKRIKSDANKFDDSEEIFYAVRATAIDLYNEKILIDEPLRITRLLAEKFSYLPKLTEIIRKDVAFLEKAQANQPTRTFLDAMAALEAIKRSIERGVRFEKNSDQMNLKFYHTQFKPQYEKILHEFMNLQGYKPDEWKVLNAKAASIYLQMGAAMTWTNYPKMAFEMFQKALPYAAASGDAKLISLTRKRVDEWYKLANPTFLERCKEILAGILSIPVIGSYLLVFAFLFALANVLDFVSWILSFFR